VNILNTTLTFIGPALFMGLVLTIYVVLIKGVMTISDVTSIAVVLLLKVLIGAFSYFALLYAISKEVRELVAYLSRIIHNVV